MKNSQKGETMEKKITIIFPPGKKETKKITFRLNPGHYWLVIDYTPTECIPRWPKQFKVKLNNETLFDGYIIRDPEAILIWHPKEGLLSHIACLEKEVEIRQPDNSVEITMSHRYSPWRIYVIFFDNKKEKENYTSMSFAYKYINL